MAFLRAEGQRGQALSGGLLFSFEASFVGNLIYKSCRMELPPLENDLKSKA